MYVTVKFQKNKGLFHVPEINFRNNDFPTEKFK